MRATKLDPNDPESYYSIGVIDWTQSYQPRMEQRAKLGLEPADALISHPQCWTLRDLNTERVKDGLAMFAKALELRPDYDDAMAYMNLIYRERADIQCGDQQASSADVETADKWVDLTIATKKRKAEKFKLQRTPEAIVRQKLHRSDTCSFTSAFFHVLSNCCCT